MYKVKHQLVRDVSECNPDGQGTVRTTQMIEVEIDWPDLMPGQPYYSSTGEWRVIPNDQGMKEVVEGQ